ncbi:MAG: maltokinase N-terminal cap-like domain-containing protein [Marmoricola sp.]
MTQNPQRAAFLADQRWFAGKGRDFEIGEVRVIARLGEHVRLELVEVRYADGVPEVETYQMPVSAYDAPQERLAHALVREGDGEWTYDAVHDKDAMAVFLEAFDAAAELDEVRFHRLPGHDLDTDAHSTLFGGEQSNSSLAFGEDSLLKFFRRLTPGANPDVEIHEALTRAGNSHVAALYGYLSTDDGGLQLAILQQFLRTASDGWDLALASARNLFTEGDLHADEVGGDFAAEAHRLGQTLASVHASLAEAFGTAAFDGASTAQVMQRRLEAATAVVPELAEHPLADRFAAVADLTGEVHRVHGDLHLGQTLRTSLGWKLVDFEGEPAKDLAERRLPDSPWRDVAGMVRSFDYAASAVARDLGAAGESAAQIAYRAGEWTAHNTHAFLAGYTEERGHPMTAEEELLLSAYVADKAVYEVVYESRNRPGWRGIPLSALGRLTEVIA